MSWRTQSRNSSLHAKVAIGPAIEDGFYYDIDIDRPFVPEDLEIIEKKMIEIIKRNTPFQRSEMSRAEAVEHVHADGRDRTRSNS